MEYTLKSSRCRIKRGHNEWEYDLIVNLNKDKGKGYVVEKFADHDDRYDDAYQMTYCYYHAEALKMFHKFKREIETESYLSNAENFLRDEMDKDWCDRYGDSLSDIFNMITIKDNSLPIARRQLGHYIRITDSFHLSTKNKLLTLLKKL